VCGVEKKVIFSRCSVEEPEEHEEGVALAEAGGDDAHARHERDDDENFFAAQRVGHRAPNVRARHHACNRS
jgi:hypothetical protein